MGDARLRSGRHRGRRRIGRDRVRVGFRVDAFVGQQEIVIKPLGKLLLKVKGIAGATILGDGNVALILDASSL